MEAASKKGQGAKTRKRGSKCSQDSKSCKAPYWPSLLALQRDQQCDLVSSKNTLSILGGSALDMGSSKNAETFQFRNANRKANGHRHRAQRPLQTPARKLTFVSKVLFISGSKLLGWKGKKQNKTKQNFCQTAAFVYMRIPTFSRMRGSFLKLKKKKL